MTSEDAMQKLQDLCEWQDEYSVGIDVIDRQHQELFRIVEQFRGNLNELSLLDCLTDSSKRIKIYGMILNMRSFFLGHFSTEERYMMRCQCPDFLVHKKEHDLFIKKVFTFEESFIEGRLAVAREIDHFLTLWLKNHTLIMDFKYVSYMKKYFKKDDVEPSFDDLSTMDDEA